MPAFFYPGDNFATRAEAAHLVMTGKLGIDYKYKPSFAGSLENRGQYLYENDEKQQLFSKYGFGMTLLFLPPYLAEKAHSGEVGMLSGSRSLLLFINLYQILFSLIIAAYMYRMAALFTERVWICVTFVLASFYTTFTWHYLRAPTHEILHLLPFVGACYHALNFMKASEANPAGKNRWLQLGYSSAWLGLLVLSKPFYVLVVPVVGVFALSADGEPLWNVRHVLHNLRRNFWRYAAFFGIPLGIAMVVLLWSNKYKFGSLFNLGNGQWILTTGVPADHFSASYMPKALRGFFSLGSLSILLHYPLLIFALVGLYQFARRHLAVFLFVLFLFLVTLMGMSSFCGYSGGWCHGPRYLIHPLLMLGLPFISTCEMMRRWGKDVRTVLLVALMVGVLGWSFVMQAYVNALHYFTWRYVYYQLTAFKVQPVEDYFTSFSPHLGYAHRALIRHKYGYEKFPPYELLESRVPAERAELLKQIDAFLKQRAQWNLYLVN